MTGVDREMREHESWFRRGCPSLPGVLSHDGHPVADTRGVQAPPKSSVDDEEE